MTKKTLAIIIALITMCLLFSGCFSSEPFGSESGDIPYTSMIQSTEKPSQSVSNQSFIEKYSFFITASDNKKCFILTVHDKKSYVNFLSDFDYDKYEIIHITIESYTDEITVTFKKNDISDISQSNETN